MIRRHFLRGMASSALISLSGCGWPHNSDADFIAWFQQNEDAFIRLQHMALEETAVEQITEHFCRDIAGDTHKYPTAPYGFSQERWNAYRELFRKLSFDAGIHIQGSDSQWIPHSIMMTASTAGLSISGSEKGYLWSRTVPKPLVERLDPPLPTDGGNSWKFLGFKRFKPEWYLYYWST